ncbi:MAG: prepilin-type N-terminal cleavage/methylation domain-containing protein [Candidatus Saccharimonadales bacterium]
MLGRRRAADRRQAGDTIVEVLVVLAVLGLAISVSYATAHRSLQATRQAEENAQATAILQSQIETMRSYAGRTDDPYNIYQTSKAFCINANGQVVNNNGMSPSDVTSNVRNGVTADYTKYDAACNQGGLFYITVGYIQSSGGNQVDIFTAKATWDDVRGEGQDTVTLVYRLHPGTL